MVGPSHGINYSGGLFHVAVFADGGEQVGDLKELIAWNAGDALDHFGCVTRIVFAEKLIDAARVLQRQIMINFLRYWRQLRTEAALAQLHTGIGDLGDAGTGIIPGGAIVGLFSGVEA